MGCILHFDHYSSSTSLGPLILCTIPISCRLITGLEHLGLNSHVVLEFFSCQVQRYRFSIFVTRECSSNASLLHGLVWSEVLEIGSDGKSWLYLRVCLPPWYYNLGFVLNMVTFLLHPPSIFCHQGWGNCLSQYKASLASNHS